MPILVPGSAPPAVAESGGKDEKPVVLREFTQASAERIQPGNVDFQVLIGATATDAGSFDLPSYGWARGVLLRVTASGGAAGLNNAVLAEDGPFSVLSSIKLTEPNGREHCAFARGWNAYLATKWGGYVPAYSADPRTDPDYSAGGNGGNFAFWLWLPFELSARSALGSQSNMDDTGQLKLQFQISAASAVWSTQPDTKPTVRVRAYLSSWNPVPASSNGAMNAQTPPAAGTTQFWTVSSGLPVNGGEQQIHLKRKGSYIRSIAFVLRRSGTSRANGESDWPDITSLVIDEFRQMELQDDLWRREMYQKWGYGAAGVAQEAARGLDNGVRVLSFASEFNGQHGMELRKGWRPTLGSTSLRIEGNFGNAGTLDVITNDVAIPAGAEMQVFS